MIAIWKGRVGHSGSKFLRQGWLLIERKDVAYGETVERFAKGESPNLIWDGRRQWEI
jgi:hypothetical protein